MSKNPKKTCSVEIEEMKKYRWCKSEEKGYDVGKDAYTEWIAKYADIWRILDDYELETGETREELEKDLNIEMNGLPEEERCKWLHVNLDKWLQNRKTRIGLIK